MIKIDLHTHSIASKDGGLSLDEYKKKLDSKELDVVAITDHNQIDFALEANKLLGDKIIVGEEIMTNSGEIIGLFLTELIPANLSLQKTIDLIKSQNGIVYIPHPFETVRKGISQNDLETIIENVDIIETINGRAVFGKKSSEAKFFAGQKKLIECASSDSHGWYGWGQTYSVINKFPSKDTILELLKESNFIYKKPSIRAILYPKYNKLKKV